MTTRLQHTHILRGALISCLSRVITLLAIVVSASAAGSMATAQDTDPRFEPAAVLILNSYQKGFAWTDEIVRGIEQKFEASPRKIELWVEYMDTKRYPDGMHRNLLYASYRHRFKTQQFDLVLTSDNNALEFALEHRAELFPETPIIFCGINHFQPDMLAGHTSVTGVAENVDLRGTVEIAQTLNSNARSAIIIIADTATGRDNEKRVKDILPVFPNLSFQFWQGRFLEDMIQDVASLSPDTFLIQFGVARTRDGRTALNDEVVRRLSEHASVPIYSDTDFTLGHGILGGRGLSGYAQGETAAAMALEVLRGKPVSEIPVLTESPNRNMFDYRVMQRFGVSVDQLPPDSIVINQPQPISRKFRNFIFGSVVIGLTLAALIVFLVSNIIRRKSAEKALRVSEGRLAALVEHSPAGIYLKDLDGRYIIANEQYRARFGMESETIVGKTSEEVLPREIVADAKESDDRVLAMASELRFERSMKCADGKTRDFMIIKFPLFDARGALSGLGSVSSDISEIKQTDEAMRALQAELAHVSRLSTMGEMAAGFAHELNQPLAAISNFATGCIRRIKTARADTESMTTALEEIAAQAKRAGDIISRIRGFVGKKDEAKNNATLSSIEINSAIEAAAGLLAGDILKHGVSLRLVLTPELPQVPADSIQIQQLVINLARNSMEAMSEARSQRRDLTIRTLANHEKVEIQVLDTGPGIPQDVRARMFHPFFTTKESGMGMGLSICKSIVERHGGELQAENRSGGGARFSVVLTATEHKNAAA